MVVCVWNGLEMMAFVRKGRSHGSLARVFVMECFNWAR